jgi:hypothetical protein
MKLAPSNGWCTGSNGIHAAIWAIGVLALACNAWVPLVRHAQGIPSGPFFSRGRLTLGNGLGTHRRGNGRVRREPFHCVGVRRTGDLELLLTTPVGAQSIVEDQWRILKTSICVAGPVHASTDAPAVLNRNFPHCTPARLRGPRQNLTLLKLLTIGNTFLGAAALCLAGIVVWFKSQNPGWRDRLDGRFRQRAAQPVRTAVLESPRGAWQVPPVLPREDPSVAWWIPELMTSMFYLGLIGIARRSSAKRACRSRDGDKASEKRNLASCRLLSPRCCRQWAH